MKNIRLLLMCMLTLGIGVGFSIHIASSLRAAAATTGQIHKSAHGRNDSLALTAADFVIRTPQDRTNAVSPFTSLSSPYQPEFSGPAPDLVSYGLEGFASLHLPQGAQITHIFVPYSDGNPNINPIVQLHRMHNSAVAAKIGEVVFPVQHTNGHFEHLEILPASDYLIIDNENYSYYMVVSTGAFHSIGRIRIDYSFDSLLPHVQKR